MSMSQALLFVCLGCDSTRAEMHRFVARLADENGFYPGTINLMHQLAKDAASCPANSVACKVLR